MALSPAQRQKAFRERKRAEGLVACTVMVHARHVSQLAELARKLAENPELEVALVRNTRTGRLEKL